jgi:hypothetical protein
MMAGAAVSCVVAPHTMWGPTDFPQARKGSKVKFSSYDGNAYDITFGANSPCKEGSTLTVSAGAPATCTVNGDEGLVYPYSVGPHGGPAVTPRALIVPCHGCIGVTSWSRKRKGTPNHVGFAPNVAIPVGAVIVVTSTTTLQLLPPIECPSTASNGGCAYQNQQATWSLGVGSQLQITFSSPSPCVDAGGNSVTSLPPGNTSKPGSLPVSCAIGQSVTPGDYPYTFQVGASAAAPATLKVMKAP